MIEISLSGTEVEILLRAISLARECGRFPDPDIAGDATRASVLAQQLEHKLQEHNAGTWGSKRLRKPGGIS